MYKTTTKKNLPQQNLEHLDTAHSVIYNKSDCIELTKKKVKGTEFCRAVLYEGFQWQYKDTVKMELEAVGVCDSTH
jgi:hypothetical protein